MADQTVTATADSEIVQAVAAGFSQITALQARVAALPEYQFRDMSPDEDDAVVWDLLGATRRVLEALDALPREAIAAALAKCMFGEPAPLSASGTGWVVSMLEELAADRARAECDLAARPDFEPGSRQPHPVAVVIPFPCDTREHLHG